MKKHEAEQMNEQQMADMAQATIPKGPDPVRFVPHKPLPEDFVNPVAGIVGHKCLDPRGNYKPDWYCLKLNKASENMPQRQYFNHNGREWLVEVGVWVDVPPQIITILSYTEQEVVSMDISKVNLVVDRSVPRVVDLVPRFSFSVLASA